MLGSIKSAAKKIVGKSASTAGLANDETQTYWTEHNVTLHHSFNSPEASLEYFSWRNDQYFNYIELMPVSGQDGKVVLDYGCGPGHDLVGFGTFSRPSRLIGADISTSSLGEAKARLAIHGIDADFIQIDPSNTSLPLESNSVDHIHSSGVLHHTPDPVRILRELHRILKPGGTMNVMVYNYDSLWVHLYVAYQRNLVQGLYPDEDIRIQFTHSTDGENCPISNCYRPQEWTDLCAEAGFEAAFTGAAISMWEMSLFPKRFDAVMDRRLRSESRRFLLSLELDSKGYPMWNGHYAGVDACFQLRKI